MLYLLVQKELCRIHIPFFGKGERMGRSEVTRKCVVKIGKITRIGSRQRLFVGTMGLLIGFF